MQCAPSGSLYGLPTIWLLGNRAGWREIRVISCNIQGVGGMWLDLDHRFLLMGVDRGVRHPVGCLNYRPYVGWETRPHWFIALLQVACLPINMVACCLPECLASQLPSWAVAWDLHLHNRMRIGEFTFPTMVAPIQTCLYYGIDGFSD